jgi:exonuclease III
MDNENLDRPERRTAFVARELKKFDLDIVALSENRRADEGQIREELGNYTFFWKGKPLDQPRIHGVGFAIKNNLLSKLNELPVDVNERLMTLRLSLENNLNLTVISAYAPTLNAEEEIKGFYDDLDKLISTTPNKDKLIILGDFNARVGKDHNVWRGVIGKDGVGKVNSSGKMLLTKCAEHNLVITNTLFRLRNSHKVSWQHPRSKHWHLIDYVIVRKRDLQDVLITKAMTAADECWTDHQLITSTMTNYSS